MRKLERLFWDMVAMIGVCLERHEGHPGSEQQTPFYVIQPSPPAT
jgi:hypothetical protein